MWRDPERAFQTAVLGSEMGEGSGENLFALGEGSVEDSIVCRQGLITEPGLNSTVNR